MCIKSTFHRLFSIQFFILILFLYHSTPVLSALNSSLTTSRTVQTVGTVRNSSLSYITSVLKIGQPRFNSTYSTTIRSFSNANLPLSSKKTTIGTTETAHVYGGLPENTTTELPMELTSQPNKVTNVTTSTTIVPAVFDLEKEEEPHWYERPVWYVTLSVIGGVTLIGVASVLVFIFKDKLGIRTPQTATADSPFA